MWFFIINILTFYLEAPFIDLYINASNNLSYYIRDDYIEVDLYMDLVPYLYYEDLTIFDEEEKHIDIENQLPVPSNFNVSDVASINAYIQFSSFELVISPDTTNINYVVDINLQLLGRENNVITYTDIHYFDNIFKEISVDYPFFYRFDDYYVSYEIRHDIRGFTHDEIYQEGYTDGYNDGEHEGYQNGYENGYNDGEYVGSMTQPIFKLFNAVFRSIDMVLQTEVLPGIKLWYIVSIPLVFLIIQFFINLWR